MTEEEMEINLENEYIKSCEVLNLMQEFNMSKEEAEKIVEFFSQG